MFITFFVSFLPLLQWLYTLWKLVLYTYMLKNIYILVTLVVAQLSKVEIFFD